MESSETGLQTDDGTKVLTVQEYDKFVSAMPSKLRVIFELATITGLRYVELQRLYDNPQWYNQGRNQIILPKKAQKKVKQKQGTRSIDKLPRTLNYMFSAFKEGKKPIRADLIDKDDNVRVVGFSQMQKNHIKFVYEFLRAHRIEPTIFLDKNGEYTLHIPTVPINAKDAKDILRYLKSDVENKNGVSLHIRMIPNYTSRKAAIANNRNDFILPMYNGERVLKDNEFVYDNIPVRIYNLSNVIKRIRENEEILASEFSKTKAPMNSEFMKILDSISEFELKLEW